MKRPKKPTRATRAAAQRAKAKVKVKPPKMNLKTLTAEIDNLPVPEPEAQAHYLRALGATSGISIPLDFDLAKLVGEIEAAVGMISPLVGFLPQLGPIVARIRKALPILRSVSMVMPLILAIIAMAKGPGAGLPGALPVVPDVPDVPEEPAGEDEPPRPPKEDPVGETKQVIKEFKRFHIVDVLKEGHQVDAQRSAEVKAGGALCVGENLRFDVTPVAPDGSEYPGNSPIVNGPTFHKQDDSNNGKSPIIEYRWGCGGEEFSNSGNDPFKLNSYEGEGGCTPNLKLTRPIGAGVNEVWIEPFVRAEYNGGEEVTGPRITFRAD